MHKVTKYGCFRKRVRMEWVKATEVVSHEDLSHKMKSLISVWSHFSSWLNDKIYVKSSENWEVAYQ